MYSKESLTNLWLAFEGGFLVLLYGFLRLQRDPLPAMKAILRYWPLWIIVTFGVMVIAPIEASVIAAAARQQQFSRDVSHP